MIFRRSVVGMAIVGLVAAGLVSCGAGSTSGGAGASDAASAAEAIPELPPPDRSGLPEAAPRVQWAPPQPEHWELPGGAKVLHVQHGGVPLVSLHLVLPRGAATDPSGKAGLNSLMIDLLDEGAGELSALQLGEAFQTMATHYSVSADVDTITFSLNMIADNFEASLRLLSDIVRRPLLSREEFERRRSQSIAEAIAGEANPRVGWTVALLEAVFGDGYAGRRSAGNQDTLGAITYEDVKAHYQAAIVSQGATFVVAGGLAKKRVDAALKKSFGDWSGSSTLKAPAVAVSAKSRSLYFVDYPGAAQSVLGVVRRIEGVTAKDHVAATIFNHGFGGSFTGRINMNLREDKGYTYGANSVFRRYRQAGFFLIVSNVRSDVTRESLDEIFSELAQVCDSKKVSTEEWEQAVGGILLGYPNEFERISSVAQQFSDIPRLERGLDWFTQWPQKVQANTLEETQAAANRYCDRAQFDVVIAGDKAKVYPKLKDLGFPLVSLDARGRHL